MRRRKRSNLTILFILCGAVFVGAVFWQVLPRERFNSASSNRLETELNAEREERKKELQRELEALREENRVLQSEIRRLKGSEVE